MNWKIQSVVVAAAVGVSGFLYYVSHQDTRQHEGPAVDDPYFHDLVIVNSQLNSCSGNQCPIGGFDSTIEYRVDTRLPVNSPTDRSIKLLGQVCVTETWRTSKQNCDAMFPIAVGSHSGVIWMTPPGIGGGKQGALIQLELRAGENNPMRTQPAMDMVAQTTSASPTWH